MKNIPVDKSLYERVKEEVYDIYDRPSAYRSGFLVKKYKEEFKKIYGNREPYISVSDERPLERWFKEKWEDVNPMRNESSYPVYRPTKRISKKTPLTINEIDKKNLLEQAALKQIIKSKKNLPPFKKI